jgi:hypothetical protein
MLQRCQRLLFRNSVELPETQYSAMILFDHRWRRFSHRCISPSGTSSAFNAKTK